MKLGPRGEKELVKEIASLRKKLAEKDRETQELKMTNLFLGTLFDGISEEIMVIDKDYNINDVNIAFLKRCGLNKTAVLGRKCYDIKQRSWIPCNTENGPCPVDRSRNTGEMVEMTHSYKDTKGDTREFITIIYPLKPEGHETKYYLEITRDVTEYRHLISKLRRSEKRFRAILDTATDAIISIDENHKIILFNTAAQRIFGYSSHEAIGKDLSMIIPPIYGDHHRHVKRFLEQKESDIIGKTISLTAIRKNGEKFPIELSLSFLEMEGEITFTAIVRDVTEQQKLESRRLQSERLAAVGQAVAHVAHEIRNPLMIIGGFSSRIKTGLDNPKDINKLEMVLDEVIRLERLVDNLGDFTKEYRLVKRSADINSIIQDVVKIMTGVRSPEKYKFRNLLSKSVKEINCDPDKLKQVLINVVSNGLDAMQAGGTISISTQNIHRGVEIRISDEGVGIPKEDLQHIFEPFYTTREQGSGLGLSISYKIIEAHKGDIWAISSPGKGATFIIQLPS